MKNKFMLRVAYVLLVATLLTTSVISGTFAKYTTSDNASDTARVAKWGMTAQITGNLFGTDYAGNSASTNADSIVAATSTSVSATENVVAPGTKNATGLTVKLSGTPEVAYKVEVSNNSTTAKDIFLAAGTYGVMVQATVNAASTITNYYTLTGTTYAQATSYDASVTYYELTDKVVLASAYYPVTWTVNNGGANTAYSKIADVYTALSTAFNTTTATNTSGVINAGTATDKTCTVSWEWAFSANDGADTILGDIAASATVVKLNGTDYTSDLTEGTDYCTDVAFGMAVTVTQVD